eukprot:scaffold897_cov402-Prasinococcus_capsulatus_cf.AAC.41
MPVPSGGRPSCRGDALGQEWVVHLPGPAGTQGLPGNAPGGALLRHRRCAHSATVSAEENRLSWHVALPGSIR